MRTRFNRTISLVIAALLLVTTLGSDVLTVNAVEADAVETYSQEESVDSVDVAPVDYVVTDAEGNVVNDDAVVEDETTTENLDEAEATGDADADEEEEIEEDGEVEEDLDEVLDFGKFDVEGATVFITAPRTAFANPDSTTVAVKAITSERQIEKVAEAIESASEEEVGVENVLVFDITFSDENGEVEPFEDVNVRFEDIALESDSYEVYHMEDANAEAELVGEDLGAVVDITSDAVEISTDEFSWYVIAEKIKLHEGALSLSVGETKAIYNDFQRNSKVEGYDSSIIDVSILGKYTTVGEVYRKLEIKGLKIGETTITYKGNDLGGSTKTNYLTVDVQGNVTVTFDANGGNLKNGSTKTYYWKSNATKYGVLATPERAGYTFDGWTYTKNGTDYVKANDTVSTDNHTLYAHWTKNKYKLTFKSGVGTGADYTVQKEFEDTYTLANPTNFTAPNGATFNGWLDKDGNKVTSYKVTADATFTADWLYGTTPVSLYVLKDGQAPKSYVNKTSGKADDDSRSGAWITVSTQGTTLNNKIASNYTQFTDMNASEIENSLVVGTYSGCVSNGVISYEENGYRYTAKVSDIDWYVYKILDSSKHVDGVVTWTKERLNYTIKYDLNGASGSIADQTANVSEDTVLANCNITKRGYTFTGWNTATDGSGTGYAAGATVKDLASNNESITLYAQWTANKYAIEFNGNENTSGEMAAITDARFDKKSTLPKNRFVKTGYSFTGWNTAADGSGTDYADGADAENLSDVNEAVVVLYAQWSANSYTVTFNKNANAATLQSDEKTVTFDGVYGELPTPAIDGGKGLTFLGWYTAKVGGEEITAGSKVVTAENHTLYAHWNVAVRYYSDEQSVSPRQVYKYSNALKDVAYDDETENKPEKTGYSFDYWYKEGQPKIDFFGQADDKRVVTGWLNLYAHFSANSYSLTTESDEKGTIDPSVTYTYDSVADNKITVNYQANEGYEIATVLVDGKEQDIEPATSGSVVVDMSDADNHSVKVTFKRSISFTVSDIHYYRAIKSSNGSYVYYNLDGTDVAEKYQKNSHDSILNYIVNPTVAENVTYHIGGRDGSGLDYRKYNSEKDITDEFTVTASADGYLTQTATAKVIVSEYDFSNVVVSSTSKDGWNNEDITLTVPDGFVINTATQGLKDSKSVVIDAEGNDAEITYYIGKPSDNQYSQVVYVSSPMTYTYKLDKVAPTANIKYKESILANALNSLTFGYFFKKNVNVSVNPADELSGVAATYYYKSAEKVADPATITAWESGKRFSISENWKGYIYAKVVDNAGNVSYAGADNSGVVVFSDAVVGKEAGTIKYTRTTFADQEAVVSLHGNTIKSISYNGTDIDKNYYTISNKNNGQTVVTFAGEFLNTLPATDKHAHVLTLNLNMNGVELEDGAYVDENLANRYFRVEVAKQDGQYTKSTVAMTGWVYDQFDVDSNAPVAASDKYNTENVVFNYATEAGKQLGELSDDELSALLPGKYTVTATFAENDDYLSYTTAPAEFTVSTPVVEFYIENVNADTKYTAVGTLDADTALAALYDEYPAINTNAGIKSKAVDKLVKDYITSNNKALPRELQEIVKDKFTITFTKVSSHAEDGKTAHIHVDVKVTQKSDNKISVSLNNWTYGDKASNARFDQKKNKRGGAQEVSAVRYYGKTAAGDKYESTEVPTQAGSYTVEATFAPTTYYAQQVVTDTFKVQQRTVNLTWTVDDGYQGNVSHAKSVKANGKDARIVVTYSTRAYTASATAGNVVNNDEVFVSLEEDKSRTDVGSKSIRATMVSNPNYKLPSNKKLSLVIEYLKADGGAKLTGDAVKGNKEWFTGDVTLSKKGYQITDAVKANINTEWKDSITYTDEKKPHSVKYQMMKDGYVTEVYTTRKFGIDKVAPTIESISASDYSVLQNAAATFNNVFLKNETTVFVDTKTGISGLDKLQYQIVDEGKEPVKKGWKNYKSTGISLKADSNQVIYVKASDKAGREVTGRTYNLVLYTDATADTQSLDYTRPNGGELTAKVNLNGNTIKEVHFNLVTESGKPLDLKLEDSAYTLNEDGNEITISDEFLQTFVFAENNGENKFTVYYNPAGMTYEQGDNASTTTFEVNAAKTQNVISNLNMGWAFYLASGVVPPTFDTLGNKENAYVEYKPEGASDDEYTREVPRRVGRFVARITVPENEDYLEATATAGFLIGVPREEEPNYPAVEDELTDLPFIITDYGVPLAGDDTVAAAGRNRAAVNANNVADTEEILDEATPLAVEDETETIAIDDEETPEGIEDIICNLHWWILLLVGAFAIYSISCGVYRKKLIDAKNNEE